VLLEDLIQHAQRPPAINHEILRDDLEPIDRRLLGENVVVMRHAQSDADAVIGHAVENIARHKRVAEGTARFRPSASGAGRSFELGWLRALAAALALATVLAFATLVAAAAIALAFATVLALAVVFARRCGG